MYDLEKYIMMNKKLLYNEIYLFSKDDNPKDIVIFSHSLSNNYESSFSQYILKSLYDNSIGIIVFNYSFFRNHTNPSSNLIDEVAQLDSVISLVENSLRPDKISLVGISLGGIISTLCCLGTKHKEIFSIFIIGFPFKLGFPPNINLLQDDNLVLSDYFLEYKQLFELVNRRVFIVQGGHDDLGDVKECVDFFNQYNNCTVFEIKGANHGFVSYKNSSINYFNDCSKLILNELIV